MSYRCTNEDCVYAETGVCARLAEFPDPEQQCVDLRLGRAIAGAGTSEIPAPLTPEHELPADVQLRREAGRFWSGFALGAEEAGSMLWDPAARLFTIMGGKDRGKTSLLTAAYILLANGLVNAFPYRFCGSRSLHGFQRLADPAFKWKGDEQRVVPRTTQSTYRQPSFLHLVLKARVYGPAAATNVLLTDMPGEWFEKWGDNGVAALPETLDFLPRSDGFMIVVDAPKALADKVYRKEVRYLLERVVAFANASPSPPRPIAVVLTKYDMIARDVRIPDAAARKHAVNWGRLATTLRSLVTALDELPAGTPWDVFPTAAFSRPSAQPVGVLAPFAFLLKHTTQFAPMQPLPAPRDFKGDFFQVFRDEAV
jgi:hypothetical protein